MIVKKNLSPVQILRYTARPMLWASGWAVAAPVIFAVSDDARVVLPFPVVGTLAAALAIFIAFQNNTAFARWNEARVAWQNVLVAGRVLARQVVASTHNAVASGTIDDDQANRYGQEIGELIIVFSWTLAQRTRPMRHPTPPMTAVAEVPADVAAAANPPAAALVSVAERIKDGIRSGALGQFDPISLEPQLVALNNAQGVIERIATTPTLRQYDYFTRRGVQLLAALVPFAILGLVPSTAWLAAPWAVSLPPTRSSRSTATSGSAAAQLGRSMCRRRDGSRAFGVPHGFRRPEQRDTRPLRPHRVEGTVRSSRPVASPGSSPSSPTPAATATVDDACILARR